MTDCSVTCMLCSVPICYFLGMVFFFACTILYLILRWFMNKKARRNLFFGLAVVLGTCMLCSVPICYFLGIVFFFACTILYLILRWFMNKKARRNLFFGLAVVLVSGIFLVTMTLHARAQTTALEAGTVVWETAQAASQNSPSLVIPPPKQEPCLSCHITGEDNNLWTPLGRWVIFGTFGLFFVFGIYRSASFSFLASTVPLPFGLSASSGYLSQLGQWIGWTNATISKSQ